MPKIYAFLLTLLWATHSITSRELKRISLQTHTVLNDFSGYQDISIAHFYIPKNVVTALFKFTARELKTGGLGGCSPRDVTIYLKYGSIALGHPDGAKIEAKLFQKRRKFYNITFASDDGDYELRTSNPAPGDWYAIAFKSWSDPDSEKITQQGLGAMCSTVLDSELAVKTADKTSVIDPTNDNTINLNSTIKSAVLQFFMPEYYNVINVSISSACENACTVAASIIADGLIQSGLINSTEDVLSFSPYPGYFHYLNLHLVAGNSTSVTISFPQLSNEQIAKNEIQLVRNTHPELFTFDFDYLRENSTKSIPFNVSSDHLTVLSFGIGGIYDVGGTLSIGVKLLNESHNIVVVGCISLGNYLDITPGASCSLSTSLTLPDFWLNSTKNQMIHIPYPEPGTWHLTLRAFKLSTNCSCASTCQAATCKNCDCMQPTSTSIETSIGSSPCIEGKCNSNGKCQNYLDTGGFAFSACQCWSGYRGFDCADDTYVLTGGRILVRLLMLTLSNLAFAGSVYVAFRRAYYTEAVVYAAVMFFSTFYHACEAGEDVMSVCITRLNVLQFCDFYNALLSIWVTLVAMASFGPKLSSFCQVSGAIVLALGAELDRTALWVFLLPAVTGFILIAVSWGLRCRRQRNFSYPASRYRNVYLPTGLGIVSIGLICYAFFQTRRNYHIVHSFWHICVAIGVVLLLPKRKHMK